MMIREIASALLLITCLAAGIASRGADQSQPTSERVQSLDASTLAKIIPGVTTETEVQALLGKPSYDVEFGSGALCPPKPSAKSINEPTVNSWNYRGRDAQGAFVVHIEFDQNYVTYLIARYPDQRRWNGSHGETVIGYPGTDGGGQSLRETGVEDGIRIRRCEGALTTGSANIRLMTT